MYKRQIKDRSSLGLLRCVLSKYFRRGRVVYLGGSVGSYGFILPERNYSECFGRKTVGKEMGRGKHLDGVNDELQRMRDLDFLVAIWL